MAFLEGSGNPDEVPETITGYSADYRPGVEFNERADRELRELMHEARLPKYIGDRLLNLHLNSKPQPPQQAELAAMQTEARVLKALGGEEAAKASFKNAGHLFDHMSPDKRARLAEMIAPFENDEWLVRSLINLGNARAAKPKPEGK